VQKARNLIYNAVKINLFILQALTFVVK